MDFDLRVKLTIYNFFAETGTRPSIEDVAVRIDSDQKSVMAAYQRLRNLRMLVLEEDGVSIRMASPFSGIPTQHNVISGGVQYYANCAWDSLGIAAALQREVTVHSRCEQSKKPLNLRVYVDGPEPSDWLFHCLVPAARWWDDIVFT